MQYWYMQISYILQLPERKLGFCNRTGYILKVCSVDDAENLILELKNGVLQEWYCFIL